MCNLSDKEQKKIDHAVEYMQALREELIRQKVTRERCEKLDELPLTARQVAYAIKKYVIEIEKREKAKKDKKRQR